MLDGLQISLSRETSKDPPQTLIKTFLGRSADESTERQVTNYPHPYPQASCTDCMV
jgi:hypothetical protein